jgi:ribosomal protein S20
MHPCIAINSSSKTALKTVFKGTEKAINHAVEKILGKRKEMSCGFQTRDDLEKFLSEEKEDVQLIDDADAFVGFAY